MYWMTTNLWTVGQGIITRRMVPKPAPPPKRSSRTAPKEDTASASTDGAAETQTPAHGRRSRSGDAGPAAPRQAQEEEGRAVSEEPAPASRRPARPSARRSGRPSASSSGCAPGLDKSAVRFEVVSEGERGLLGVGYAPARVVASVDTAAVSAAEPVADGDESDARSRPARPARADRRRAPGRLPGRRHRGRRDGDGHAERRRSRVC